MVQETFETSRVSRVTAERDRSLSRELQRTEPGLVCRILLE